MKRLRYIGSDPTGVELVCSGRSFGVVEPDTVVEVPDDVYDAHAWAEDLWAEVDSSKSGSTNKSGKGGN